MSDCSAAFAAQSAAAAARMPPLIGCDGRVIALMIPINFAKTGRDIGLFRPFSQFARKKLHCEIVAAPQAVSTASLTRAKIMANEGLGKEKGGKSFALTAGG